MAEKWLRVKNYAHGAKEVAEHVAFPLVAEIVLGPVGVAAVVGTETVLDYAFSYDRLTDTGTRKPTRRELWSKAAGKGFKAGLVIGTAAIIPVTGPLPFVGAMLGTTEWDALKKQRQMDRGRELATTITQGVLKRLPGGK